MYSIIQISTENIMNEAMGEIKARDTYKNLCYQLKKVLVKKYML